MKRLALFFFTAIHFTCSSQEHPKFAIKTAPISYLTINPGLCVNLGAEIKLFRNVSIDFNYMKSVKKSLDRIKGELRFYLPIKKMEDSYPYLALEYMYKYQRFYYSDSIGCNSCTKVKKEYKFVKYINTANLKFGVSYRENNFLIEPFIGIGVRYKNVYCMGLTEDEIENRVIGSPERMFFTECGKYTRPNLTIGFNIGYVIR